jgi:3-oxoacyl-(acyl-carrier-protein) synthase
MIVATGLHAMVLSTTAPSDARVDPTPFLREKKSRKYMGLQDELAVVCAGRALEQAAWAPPPGERTGLYAAVGYIPFRERDVDPVLDGSLVDGAFSLTRFAAEGFMRAHPLLAFRCLPNMPAYHVAASFGIEGPYCVSYPSAGQFYLALEQATIALDERRVDVALVLGVADQRNFLVEHHFSRIQPPVAKDRLRDAGAAVVLERDDDAARRGATTIARLADLTVGYRTFDPREGSPEAPSTELELGPAEPLVRLAEPGTRHVVHRYLGRDGIVAACTWERP